SGQDLRALGRDRRGLDSGAAAGVGATCAGEPELRAALDRRHRLCRRVCRRHPFLSCLPAALRHQPPPPLRRGRAHLTAGQLHLCSLTMELCNPPPPRPAPVEGAGVEAVLDGTPAPLAVAGWGGGW